MASSDPVQPQVVEYDRITGVPSEFNEYLPKCAAIARTGSHGGRCMHMLRHAVRSDGPAAGATPQFSQSTIQSRVATAAIRA